MIGSRAIGVVDGVVADWWRVALEANRIFALSRVEYPLAADLDAANAWIQIFDPWVGLRDVVADQFWDPAVGFRRVPGGHEDLRSAIEIAVTSATVDRVGLGMATVEIDLLSYEHDPDQVLFPNPQPGERITTLIERLEWGLTHMQVGGGVPAGRPAMRRYAARADRDRGERPAPPARSPGTGGGARRALSAPAGALRRHDTAPRVPASGRRVS
jgi:hypothetical protein